jgi:hypothetical protein
MNQQVSAMTRPKLHNPEPSRDRIATVRDSSRSAASAGRSRHGEHSGVRVSLAETLVDEAYQQPRFAESDVWHSLRMTGNACAGVFDGQRVGFSGEGGEGGRHLGQAGPDVGGHGAHGA